MKTKTCLSLLAAFAASALVAATPVIKADSVTFSQNTTTRLVTIGYTLEETDAVVTVDVLTNGVSIGEENFANIDGDVNRRVAPGDHLIVWHPRASWPDHVFTNNEVSVEVRAWDVTIPPDYMVVNLASEVDRIRYYVSEKALPDGGLANDVYRTTKLVMRRIPASGNVWTMGSSASNTDGDGLLTRTDSREKQHLVMMTNDYYIGVFPTTQAQHERVVGNNPIATTSANYNPLAPVMHNYPSIRGEDVDWPSTGHAVGSSSFLKKWRDLTGIDFDLPTSAQWEFAARAGTSTSFFFGPAASSNDLPLYAWCKFNSDSHVHKVGELLPNPFGLYDVYGQSWDWCLDYSGYISDTTSVVVEPEGPASSAAANDSGRRVGRGGGITHDAAACRSAKVNPQNVTAATAYRLLCPPTLKW